MTLHSLRISDEDWRQAQAIAELEHLPNATVIFRQAIAKYFQEKSQQYNQLFPHMKKTTV